MTAMGRLAALAGALLLGCGGGGDGGGTAAAAGTAGASEVVSGSVSNNVISVPVSVDGAPAQAFVVDTGSIVMVVNPDRFPGAGISPGFDQLSTVDIGTLRLMNVDALAASLCGAMMMCRGTEPAGLLGGQVLLDYRLTIDYHAMLVTFGELAQPTGVGPPVTKGFSLEGGGEGEINGTPISLPATRISLDVEIEGTTMRMVLDTGSSTMILRPDVYDAIVADGRPQSSTDVATVMGTQTAPLTRLHTVAVAGALQMEVDALRAPLDVASLEDEVGHRVDGLLGGAYLASYVTTIDYPNRTLTLRPYIEMTTAR
jgi:hypothetical protein